MGMRRRRGVIGEDARRGGKGVIGIGGLAERLCENTTTYEHFL